VTGRSSRLMTNASKRRPKAERDEGRHALGDVAWGRACSSPTSAATTTTTVMMSARCQVVRVGLPANAIRLIDRRQLTVLHGWSYAPALRSLERTVEFRTVFDLTTSGYKAWWFPCFGLVFVALGVAFVRYPDRWPAPRTVVRTFGFYWLGFSILLTLFAFGATFSEYWSLRSAIRDGTVSVVDGPVSQFEPMPYAGHAMERFCVRNICFEYSNYVVTSGFNNTSSHGGPIREGLLVRVSYVRGKIVRLEVAE
jgi:hypothetical protein